MYYKWQPSKKKIREFKEKMNEIDDFCLEKFKWQEIPGI